MPKLQIEMAIAALFLLIIILFCLIKSRMSIRNSIAWLLLPLVFLLVTIFPGPVSALATSLGFETLANFIFLVVIGLLIIICFFLTVALSREQNQIKKLIQEVSILKSKAKKDEKK